MSPVSPTLAGRFLSIVLLRKPHNAGGKDKLWEISGTCQLLLLLNAGHDKGLICFRALKKCSVFFLLLLFSTMPQNYLHHLL